jgi:signal transduction histidine kinase
MKLRARLILTVLIVSVPAAAALSLIAQSMRRQALIESVYEATLARMEDGGREQCERTPVRIARREARAARGRGRGIAKRLARERHVYDDAGRPLAAAMPPLDDELRSELDSGEIVAVRDLGGQPPRVRIAMRMPWDGPCSIVVVDRAAAALRDDGGVGRLMLWSLLVAGLTALAALFAMGPMVRRLRRLAADVRASRAKGEHTIVEAKGADEIAELARAFNDANREIEEKLGELAARDKALTEFLASTTHDVMVPLTVLQGHLSDLRGALKTGKPVDATKLSSALEEAHYLGALVRNLSAAARLDAGEPMLTRHAFDLRGLIERVIARHRPIADERKIELAHAVPEAAIEVVADSTLVEQMISNLVHNAVKYNHAGGHVAVVLEDEARGRFTLRVVDDGPGIPAAELARVGERRFRGGAARKRRPTGLGLGLHIVRDVADKHGWALRFESPDEGGLAVTIDGARAK